MKTSTVNKKEIDKFNRLAAEWWNPEGKFKPLHKFNPIRIKYIKDNIIQHFNIKSKKMPLKNINVAKIYSKKKNLEIKYICSPPEKLKIKKKFDVLLMLEIIEHVDDINLFIKQSSKFLKKNGFMFIATLNKTLKSYVFAIVGAEYILSWLPIGTHDWEKFVKPNELIDIAKSYKLNLIDLSGLKFNPLFDNWNLTSDKSVNYIANFTKN